jgi:hypothetical protein
VRTPARLVAPALVVAVVAGCTGAGPDPAPPAASTAPTASATTTAPQPSPTASASPAPSTPPPPAAPAPVRWEAGPGEVSPEIKTAAARVVEGAGTWALSTPAAGPAGAVGRAVATGLVAEGTDAGRLAAALAPLADDDAPAAAARVVYPQYGGLEADAASVMVVVEQEVLSPDGTTAARGVSLDVRLAPGPDGTWRVTGVVPPPRRPAGEPSALGRAVLDDPRVHLPPAAVDDVRAGLVTDEVLAVLQRLAAAHEVDVSVLRTGHPDEVFGTDRTSNHTRGRAVDVWRVDGRLVVDPASRDVVVAALRAAAAAGATEVGGPVDLDGGPGGGWFSDDLHADHLHVGVTEGEEPVSAEQLAAAAGG